MHSFLEETFAILKNKKVGLFRADSGFCSEAIMQFIEDKQVAYVMSCKLSARLQSIIYGINDWQSMGLGIWITEITFKQGNWSKPRRIVVIKQHEELRKRTTGKKLRSLFKLEDIDRVKYLKPGIMLLSAIKHCLQTKFGNNTNAEEMQKTG